MSSETSTIIHYVDTGSFYSVYGISTLVILILLMWYFVRTNLETNNMKCSGRREGLGGIPIEDPDIMKLMPEFNGSYEFKPIPITPEGEPKSYKHWGGLYGDVPLYIYDIKDVAYKPEWDHNSAIYVPNMRTTFRQTYTPIEASFW